MKLTVVHQLNGDVRIDDADEDAPMLRVEFFDAWARGLNENEKEEVLTAAFGKICDIFEAKNDRREALETEKDAILIEANVPLVSETR